jgi:hypothetical protein
LTRSPKSLVRDVRGAAIYVEFLVIAPVIVVLWIFANYAHRLGESEVKVQRQARECAWAQATGGCRGAAPAGCQLEGPAAMNAAELESVAGTGLAGVVRPIQGLGSLFRRPAGEEVVARTSADVARPAILGGPASTAGMSRLLCNDRPRGPQLSEVVDLTCRGLLGQGGQCP